MDARSFGRWVFIAGCTAFLALGSVVERPQRSPSAQSTEALRLSAEIARIAQR